MFGPRAFKSKLDIDKDEKLSAIEESSSDYESSKHGT
jgi:hypothetical protein